MSNREEFERWHDHQLQGDADTCPHKAWELKAWQAATSASDARYQARIKELEEALQLICTLHTAEIKHKQRALLEARIDERRRADGFDSKMVEELQLQLAALGE